MNRDKRITVRLSQIEEKKLVKHCKSIKQRKAQYVRSLVLNEINKDFQST
jgi:hypothetical protein